MASLMSSRSFKVLALAGVATFTAVFGGCANEAALENEALTAQIAQDKQERDLLEARVKQGETDNQSLRQQVDTANQRAATAEAMKQPPQGSGAGPDLKDPPRQTASREIHRYNLAGDGLFSAGRAELNSAGRKQMDTVIASIKRSYPRSSIRVEAFTDTDPIRKAAFASNKALSQARANAVEKYMASKGISSGRVTAVGRGESSSKKSKAANRRVEIVILG